MLEILFILYIILLFIFPIPALAIFLGLVTTVELYRKFHLYKHQPSEGRNLLALNAAASALNFLIGLGVALALALMVHFLILENVFLLAFNFFFSAGVSVRWFDYTHRIYRGFVNRMSPPPIGKPSFFVLCRGFRRTRFGWGMLPTYTDAGTVAMDSGEITFQGVFSTFKLSAVSGLEKKSFEKIKFIPGPSCPVPDVHMVILVIKEQFYPFKSRETRDRLFQAMQNLP